MEPTDGLPAAGAADAAIKRVGLLRTVAASVHGGVDEAALRAEGIDPSTVVDFSSNQSPLGAPAGVAAAVAGATIDAYPDPQASVLAAALARRHEVAEDSVIVGNGSTELIRLIAQLALGQGFSALSLWPSFGEYEVATKLAGARFSEQRLVLEGSERGFVCDLDAFQEALRKERPRICWLCSPNNPTGAALDPDDIVRWTNSCSQTLFVLDEAYCDLLSEPQWTARMLAARNLIVLRSMTKIWGLAGLRLGYALGAPGLIDSLRHARAPWSVNACAQAGGLAALDDPDHYARAVAALREGKEYLAQSLAALGFAVVPSAAGFMLVYVADGVAARRMLLTKGCLVRDCTSFGLPQVVRISPHHQDDNERLVAAFAALPRDLGRDGIASAPATVAPPPAADATTDATAAGGER